MADKELQSIMEAFYNAAPYGNPQADDSSEERVTYSKTQKHGSASVTTSANADSMDELHKILKLAGIDVDGKEHHDHDHDHEEGDCDDTCPDDCPDCDHEEAGGDDSGPIVVSLKPKGEYNPVGGDKKEILNALMNRYKSL